MRIVVTQADKDRADVERAGSELWLCCPVAQALKRRGFQFVSVDGWKINWRHRGQFRQVPTPEKAFEWIARYDAGQDAPPFQFELEAKP